MSELLSARRSGGDSRWRLLTTASSLTLLAAVCGPIDATANDQDTDRPTVWIELGGQLERVNDSQVAYFPPFMAAITKPNLLSALNVQQPPANSLGEEARISFQPEESDWVFSASILYGRAQALRHLHHQTPNAKVHVHVTVPPPFTAFRPAFAYYYSMSWYPNGHKKFADGNASQGEQHSVVDFQAGKDVGLGMFGNRGSSILSAGVRFAQFSSKSNIDLRADPDVQYPSAPIVGSLFTAAPKWGAFRSAVIDFHDYNGILMAQRSFRGVGPTIAWNASAPFVGNPEHAELTFDWGANAAVLFGRQKVKAHTQTTTFHYHGSQWNPTGGTAHVHNGIFFGTGDLLQLVPHTTNLADFNRAKSVVVPNLGGFAGISFLYSSAKISFGYRADLFFGAMDGGIGAVKKENVGFYGPFASISVGLGG